MKRTTILVLLAALGVTEGVASAAAPSEVPVASVASVASVAPARAAAPPAASAEKMGEARARVARGRQLSADGDYKGARVELARAYELAPTYKLLYEIAECERQLGDFVAAIGHIEQHLREGGDAIDAARRAEIQAELTNLGAHVARVRIKVNVPDAELLVDDQSVGAAPAEPIALNPGRHNIWATKGGYYPESKRLTVEASQNVDVVLNLRPVPTVEAPLSARILGSPLGRAALIVIPLAVVALVVARRMKRRGAAGTSAAAGGEAAPRSVDIEIVEPTPAHAVPIVYDADAAGDAPTLASPMVLESAVKQDIGKVKPTNQDSYLLSDKHGLFAIADGIGGNAGGDVASALAVRAIEECFDAGALEVGQLTHLPREAGELARAVYAANLAIRRRQAIDWNISEMGTTCVVGRFCRDAQRMYIAHIGDSRAYRLREGKIEQMTTDHTMAELGLVGPRANHLSRALGSDPCPKIDVLSVHPLAGDVYLFCSDGLTKMMTVEQLAGILRESASANDAVASLVDLANAQGGQDNITVVVTRVVRT